MRKWLEDARFSPNGKPILSQLGDGRPTCYCSLPELTEMSHELPSSPLPEEQTPANQPPERQAESAPSPTQQSAESGQGSGEERPGQPSKPRILIGSQRDPAAYRPRPGKPLSPLRPRPSGPNPTASSESAEQPAETAREQPLGAEAGQIPPLGEKPAEQPQQIIQKEAAAKAELATALGAEQTMSNPDTSGITAKPLQARPSPGTVAATGPVPDDRGGLPGEESTTAVGRGATPSAENGQSGMDSESRLAGESLPPDDRGLTPPAGIPSAPRGPQLERSAITPSALDLGLDEDQQDAEEQGRLDQELERLEAAARSSAAILKKDSNAELLNRRMALPPDLEKEFAQAMGDVPVEQLIDETAGQLKVGQVEPESRQMGKVLAVRAEHVFIELGLREQGIVPLKSFREPPEVGQSVEVRVVRFVPDEGVYELVLPAAAADVADWADLTEGMLVEARVTGVNQGGLECEVNRIRGFIPISQIDLFRVEKPQDYVGQAFTCVVLEADAARKNLVLSRRAVLEREREQAQRLLWDSLEPGQVRDGVVRRLTEFGAFVDLGGVDGLLHVSQIAWGRVKHPSEILREGQTIRVRIDKVDRENRRIGLGYRDLISNPWEDAEKKYVVNSIWPGRVTRLMDFGAFVELEPGIEGLVHISELSLKRVSRVSDVVKEGDTVDVMVLSFDPEERRISLSMRAVLKLKETQAVEQAPAEATASEQASPPEPPPPPKKRKPIGPLKGGLGAGPSSSPFGLKW